MQIYTGTYTGNQTARDIGGVPFAPAFVFIYTHAANPCHVKNLAMTSLQVGAWTGTTDTATGHIISLNSDGFSLSASASGPNVTGRAYVFVCLSDDSDIIEAGLYTGDGNATQTITRTRSFTPVVGMVGGVNPSDTGYYRQADMPANESLDMTGTGAATSTGLRSYSTSDFVVGSTLNQNGRIHHYLLLASKADTVAADSYLHGGGADNRDIVISPAFSPTTTVFVGGTAGASGARRMLRDATHVGDSSFVFGAGTNDTDNIQAINSDGFEVGTELNTDFGSGTIYYYWCLGPGQPPALLDPTLPDLSGFSVGGVLPFAPYQRYKSIRTFTNTVNNLVIGP